MASLFRTFASVSAIALMQGCAALGGKTDVDHMDKAGVTVVSYEAESRGAYFANNGSSSAKYCAEPPPDVALKRALEAAGKVDYKEVGAEASAKLSSEAIQLAGRSQLLLLARELLYRTCELSLNGVSGVDAQKNYDQVVELIKHLGQAELKSAENEEERLKVRLKELESTAAEIDD